MVLLGIFNRWFLFAHIRAFVFVFVHSYSYSCHLPNALEYEYLSLALSPLLLSQQSHAIVRSSGPSAVSSSARIPPTHVFTSYQTRLQHAPRACPASAASVPSISGCSKEVVQPPSRARLAALLKATPRPFT